MQPPRAGHRRRNGCAPGGVAAGGGEAGDRIRYTTPLLREVQAGTPTVWAYRTAGLLYIKVYDGSLRFAGVIPAPDTADVCYFTERLEKEFTLKSCELKISGDDAKACGKLLKGYFKRIVCE